MSMKKLQTEIDRVLKKVSEGVETFESIFDKINSTTNPSQKEKYEQELKKEIKKLQRLRDQIKTWLSSNEIKDKRALLENRKLIESQMERFKMTEKEMKTKAYSKEGLLLKEKMDPKEKEKTEACDWIISAKNELERQVEMSEAQVETLQSTTKRGKKDHAKAERIEELEHQITRHKHHVNRLELLLRLLENDRIATERVLEIKEDVQYYIECNQEPDFQEDEFIYDDLNLEEEEELYGIGADEHGIENPKEEEKPLPRRAAKSKEKEKEKDKEEIASNASSTTPHKAQSPRSKEPLSTPTSEAKSLTTSPLKSPPSMPVSRSLSEVIVPPPPASTGLKYAQAAAAGVSQEKIHKRDESNKAVENAWAEPPKISDHSTRPSSIGDSQQSRSGETALSQSLLASEYPAAKSPKQEPPADMRLPPSLSDLAPSFEAIRSKGTDKPDIMHIHQMLDASLQHVPDLIDSERPKTYQPRSPYPTPNYYPQQPLPVFDNPLLYEKLDMHTLFFIFYYQQGTYQQYLAAKELKRQSWRFHKKYLTWFQRLEEPKFISDEYEQGSYVYFDYESAWCQRKKEDFRFEYRYLEEA
ncbi:hypothetical protein K492DRAFT_206681 [Lichtheimia hyalospora FSU 10163]|nr:hypothetical protein K492DRAFT_206681 [Lichtheimia hyalospora FSU 10163]